MEMDGSFEKLLGENFLFSKLNNLELHDLATLVWTEELPAGSHVVQEGDAADALYVVVKGGINVQKQDGQFLSYLGKGGFFGEMALFSSGTKRSADCVSAKECTLVVVRREVLEEYCHQYPKAGLKIYRAIIATLADRLQATSADLAMLMSTQVKKQEAVADIVAKAKERRGN